MSRTSSPARFHLPAVFVGVVALLGAACSGSPTAPPSPSPLSAASNASQGAGGGAPQSSAGKVDVCHRSGRGFHLINVSGNALQAHLRHGDGQPLGSVPGSTDKMFGASCEVLQQYTVTLVSGASGSVGDLDSAISYAKALGGSGTAVIIQRNPAWASLAGAQWVNWAINGAPHAGDDITYSTAFTLPAGAINASLNGTFYADNRGDGLLNGAAIGGHPAGPGFQGGHYTPVSVSASSGFVPGSNTLAFKVQDYGGIAGLTFSATVTYWAP